MPDRFPVRFGRSEPLHSILDHHKSLQTGPSDGPVLSGKAARINTRIDFGTEELCQCTFHQPFALTTSQTFSGTMREARSATLVTATQEGLIGTPLPMLLNENRRSERHALCAHCKSQSSVEADAISRGDGYIRWAEAYVSPSWYATKQETHKVVPTWNYIAVHAYGPVEFFDDAERLLDVITRLTDLHEKPRKDRWAVTDAPTDFVKAQLRGIIGLRMPISRLDGKRKMSQNCGSADRAGVIKGLSESHRSEDHVVASLISRD